MGQPQPLDIPTIAPTPPASGRGKIWATLPTNNFGAQKIISHISPPHIGGRTLFSRGGFSSFTDNLLSHTTTPLIWREKPPPKNLFPPKFVARRALPHPLLNWRPPTIFHTSLHHGGGAPHHWRRFFKRVPPPQYISAARKKQPSLSNTHPLPPLPSHQYISSPPAKNEAGRFPQPHLAPPTTSSSPPQKTHSSRPRRNQTNTIL